MGKDGQTAGASVAFPYRHGLSTRETLPAIQAGPTAQSGERGPFCNKEQITMSRANKAFAILVVAVLGLWGCTQSPTNGANVEKIKALESRCAKLDDDCRAMAAARDQARKKVAAVEEDLRRKDDQSQAVVKERDELRQQLEVRTAVRDAYLGQFDQLRKGMRSLLGQADSAAAGLTGAPVTATGKMPTGGQS
jgi:septal ring factor EnvC (AmiA/AmiB activator)